MAITQSQRTVFIIKSYKNGNNMQFLYFPLPFLSFFFSFTSYLHSLLPSPLHPAMLSKSPCLACWWMGDTLAPSHCRRTSPDIHCHPGTCHLSSSRSCECSTAPGDTDQWENATPLSIRWMTQKLYTQIQYFDIWLRMYQFLSFSYMHNCIFVSKTYTHDIS